MQNPLKFTPTRLPLMFAIALGLSSGVNLAQAAPPNTAPPELKNTLAQIDTAANSQNVQAVMQFYSPNFTHTDGLNRQNMEKALTQLWQQYPQLKYNTQLQSWDRNGNGIVAVTVTQVSGTQSKDGRTWGFNSTIRSRQRLENQKIVRQEILSERTQLTSGDQPPTVDVKLPEKLRPGQEYQFDAIVKEPLGDDLLVGAAVEEPINVEKYLNPASVELEPLNAGGIFKVGRAPTAAGKYWISAVVVRSDGMTIVTQRLNVENSNSSSGTRRR